MIQVRVRAIGALAQAMASTESTVTLDSGATVEDLLRGLLQEHGPSLARWLADSDGRSSTSHTRTLVNGRDLFVLDDVRTRLRDGDLVSLIPVVAGGA